MGARIVANAGHAIDMARDTGGIAAFEIVARRTTLHVAPGKLGVAPAATANAQTHKIVAVMR